MQYDPEHDSAFGVVDQLRVVGCDPTGGLPLEEAGYGSVHVVGDREAPPGEDMDGKQVGLLETPVGEPIATHETRPIERLAVTPSGGEDGMLDQLEALGYFEGK